jgi:hypothetical protein
MHAPNAYAAPGPMRSVHMHAGHIVMADAALTRPNLLLQK